MSKTQATKSVSRKVFRGMHKIAQKEDIDGGGLYDSRSVAINIWCSPEDKPTGYDHKIKKHALNYPCDYIATIVVAKTENGEVYLELQVDPERGGTEPLGQHADVTDNEVKWAEKKFEELIKGGETLEAKKSSGLSSSDKDTQEVRI